MLDSIPKTAIKAAPLPPIRSTLEQAKADLDEFGVARFSGASSSRVIAEARARLVEQADGERAAGIAHLDNGYTAIRDENARNQRVWSLLNKGDVFRNLVLNSAALALIRHVLGTDVTLFSLTANIAYRGGLLQVLHTDQMWAPADIGYPLMANCLWMLDEFSEENGATRVVPNSHTLDFFPSDTMVVETVPATGPPGTIMVWDGRIWHGTGVNQTDQPRYGVLAAFCRPFVRPQENSTLSASPELLAGGSEELLTLLGFTPYQGLGSVDGNLSGTLRKRPTEYSRALGSNGTPQ